MRRSDAFPSQFLGKADVQTPIVGVVELVQMQDIKCDHGNESKPVMFFSNGIKPFILNNTNWMVIEDSYGDDSDKWAGQQVEMYFDPSIMFGGKRAGGVRVRIPVSRQVPPQPRQTLPVPATGSAVAGEVTVLLPEVKIGEFMTNEGPIPIARTTIGDVVYSSGANAQIASDMEKAQGKQVRIKYEVGKQGRRVLSIAPIVTHAALASTEAQHQPLIDDDIPF